MNLLDEILTHQPPPAVKEYQHRFGILALLSGRHVLTPPAAVRAAYDRYFNGDSAALADLQAELDVLRRTELLELVVAEMAAMTVDERREVFAEMREARGSEVVPESDS